jgi:HSP90 family molecular chaperone
MQEILHFKTNTLLKNLVGKDLINDDSIAVVELVKNAHDAGSEEVLIRFEGFDRAEVTTADSRLIIRDQGSGMNRADIEDKWLNIAYSDKTVTSGEESVHFAGNKGIGRFSCDRLGEQLDLLTRKSGDDIYHLSIPWPAFEKEGEKDLLIQSIGVSLTTISAAGGAELAGVSIPKHGTVL